MDQNYRLSDVGLINKDKKVIQSWYKVSVKGHVDEVLELAKNIEN